MPDEIFTSEERQRLLTEIEVLRTENIRLANQFHQDIYKDFFDAHPDIIFKLDLDFKISYVHLPERSQEYIESISHKNIFEVIPKIFHASMHAGIEKLIQSGTSFSYETAGEFLGEEKYYENFLSPVKNKTGSIVSIFFYSKDITKQKLIEQNLIKNQHTLNTIFENSEHFISVISLDRKFIWFNKKSEALSPVVFGRKLELDGYAETFVPEKNRASFIKHFNDALKGEHINYIRQYVVNGSPIYLEIFINPVYENGNITSVSLIGVDITRHKEHEDYLKSANIELIKQNERLNAFSYIISHNLRAPIVTLLGLTSIFDQVKTNTEEMSEVITYITKSANHLDTVIKDLNNVLTVTDQKSVMIPVDLYAEFDIVRFLLKSEIEQSKAIIEYDFSKCQVFNSIKSYIHSILFNLLSNAIKYKKQHAIPHIIVKSYMNDAGSVCIEFSDDGIGVDMDKFKDKIFGFYKRFHSHVEGKGLGLHLIKKQIDALEGQIEVNSAVGKGTTFKILLPLNCIDVVDAGVK